MSNLEARPYLEMARATNGVAVATLNGAGESAGLEHKVSLGLSLQSIELSGKAILIALGQSPSSVVSAHRRHDLWKLWDEVRTKLKSHTKPSVVKAERAWYQQISVEGTTYADTVGGLMEKMLTGSEAMKSRSYFYPDEPGFKGPAPLRALSVVADDLSLLATTVLDEV